MITKSDFLLYMHSPMHLWARKNNLLVDIISDYEQHIIEQGKETEVLAKEYLRDHLTNQNEDYVLEDEKTFIDGHFQARVDILVFDPQAEVYDIYEIKSASSLKKEHKYDITFQHLVIEANIPVRGSFLVHVNKDYVREGEVNLKEMFLTRKRCWIR